MSKANQTGKRRGSTARRKQSVRDGQGMIHPSRRKQSPGTKEPLTKLLETSPDGLKKVQLRVFWEVCRSNPVWSCIMLVVVVVVVAFWLFRAPRSGDTTNVSNGVGTVMSGGVANVNNFYGLTNVAPETLKARHGKRLAEIFPLGWALFEVSDLSFRTGPYIMDFFELDWSPAKIEKMTPDEIIVRLPDMYSKRFHNSSGGWRCAIRRRVGAVQSVGGVLDGVAVAVTILESGPGGVLMAIGFYKH